MVWPRYLFYFVGFALLTWMLTQLEIAFPGSLKLHVIVDAAEAKTISPAIHIGHQPRLIDTVDLICQYDLQVANRGFLEVVAAGVAIQIRAH